MRGYFCTALLGFGWEFRNFGWLLLQSQRYLHFSPLVACAILPAEDRGYGGSFLLGTSAMVKCAKSWQFYTNCWLLLGLVCAFVGCITSWLAWIIWVVNVSNLRWKAGILSLSIRWVEFFIVVLMKKYYVYNIFGIDCYY